MPEVEEVLATEIGDEIQGDDVKENEGEEGKDVAAEAEEENPIEKLSAEEQELIYEEVKAMEDGPLKTFRVMGMPGHVFKGKERIELSTILEKSKYIALLFSASWCSPCKEFLPTLTSQYKKINDELFAEENKGRGDEDPKAFEIILIPCDNNKESYEEFYKNHPWCSVAYEGISFHRSLTSQQHDIDTVPTLVFYSVEGELLTKEGVDAITRDTKLDQFPYKDWKVPMIEQVKAFVLSKLPLIIMVCFMLWRNWSTHQSMKDVKASTTTSTTTALMELFDNVVDSVTDEL